MFCVLKSLRNCEDDKEESKRAAVSDSRSSRTSASRNARRCMVQEALVLLEWKVKVHLQLLLTGRDAAGSARGGRVLSMSWNLGCSSWREDPIFESFLWTVAGRARAEARHS